MAKDNAAEQTTEDGTGKKKVLPLAIAITVGVLVGGGGGAFLVGPLLASRIAPPAAAAEKGAKSSDEDAEGEAPVDEEDEPAADEDAEGKNATPAVVHTVDNLVMNPAGSNGTRFLMLSVAFSLGSEEVKTEMTARDAEVRDAVLGVLGGRTVEQLANVAGRDSLKLAMRDSVSKLFGKRSVRRVFLPQFVIQ